MDKERFKGHTAGRRLLSSAVSGTHTESIPASRGEQAASLCVQGFSSLISVKSLQPHTSTFLQALMNF